MYELPCGNTQQLNLDWFIKRWQEFYEEWEQAKTDIDGALDEEVQKVEDAMQDLYAARDAAAASATAAAASASSADEDATIAANAATAAAASATLANSKASAAGLSEAAAGLSATNAANSATAAATSASQANASESAATASAQAAAGSASDASDSATAAAGSASDASDSADDAADSATAAAASATAAAASAASLTVDTALDDTSTNPVQNKVINAALIAQSEAIAQVDDYLFDSASVDFTQIPTKTGAIGASSGNWTTSSGNVSYFVPVPDGAYKLKIKANTSQHAIYAFLKTDIVINGTTPEFATGGSRVTVDANTEATVTIPTDCSYVAVTKTTASGGSKDYTPATFIFEIEPFQNLTDDTKSIIGYIDLVTLLRTSATVRNGYVANDGTMTVGGARSSYELSNSNYSAITITASDNNSGLSFLTASINGLSNGDHVSFCEKEEKHLIAANTTQSFVVPPDCNYIVITKYTLPSPNDTKDNTPQNGFVYNSGCAIVGITKELLDEEGLSHSKVPVTACIIGASLEAGTTHETAGSDAVINPAKAYMTVALQNNGVTVTNLSHGGMGYVKQASNDKYDETHYYTFKYIVDNTDFTAFDSVYIFLGANDWNYDYALGTLNDTVGDQTVCGMLKYGIETILNSNPMIKMFISAPKLSGAKGDATTKYGWLANNSATVPYSEKDLDDAITEVCDNYLVEKFFNPTYLIANVYNLTTVLPDGKHPSQAVMAQMAKAMTGRITFK